MNVTSKTAQEEALIERLLQHQPGSQALLVRLQTRFKKRSGPGAFAPIQDGRCSACHMVIAVARLQRARAGAFITCGNCSRFLYSTAAAAS
jgi:predicted  nucleic acid-binding Zn-ribbon protein